MTEPSWTDVDDYLAGLLAPEDEGLRAALAASADAGLPAIAVSPLHGKLLALLVAISGARRVLEVGTLGGYSAIWMGRALPDDGRLLTLELDEAHARVARMNLDRVGLASKVEVRVGPARTSLQALDETFDLVFIDADKASTPLYLTEALRLTRSGALIVVDNVVRGGSTLDPNGDPSVQGVREALTMLAGDPRLDATALQTVGVKGWDGLAIARVR